MGWSISQCFCELYMESWENEMKSVEGCRSNRGPQNVGRPVVRPERPPRPLGVGPTPARMVAAERTIFGTGRPRWLLPTA